VSVADEIKKLAELRESGALSSAEFERAKARLLGSTGDGTRAQPGATATFAAMDPPINRLRRSETDRWISGVCGGLARFTDVESWVWRAGFAIASFFGGLSVVVYVVLWILVPREDPI
jgi:phage shock protein C